MPLISIIVPIYNNDKYLPECMDSLLAEKSDDLEFILVNDGSQDTCVEICGTYADADNRVKVIHQANQGVSAARNAGIAQAKGEWLMFVDADDYLSVDYYKKINPLLKKELDIIIFGPFQDIKKTMVKCIPQCPDNQLLSHRDDFIHLQSTLLDYRYKHEYFNHTLSAGSVCGKCYKASFIKDNDISFPDGVKMGEDNIFNLYAFEFANTALISKCPFYYYRQNPESIMNRYNPTITELHENMLKHIFYFFSETKKTTHFQNLLHTKCVGLAINNVKMDFLHPDNKQKYSHRKQQFIRSLNNEPYKCAFKNIKINVFPPRITLLLVKYRCFFILSIFMIIMRNLSYCRKYHKNEHHQDR